MPVNAHPEYVHAEKEYHLAQTPEEQQKALETMISFAPSHKGGENLRAQLKTRYKKLKESILKSKKTGKRTKVGIKKDDMQLALVGFTNSGKSTLLKKWTNADPKISEIRFTTQAPVIGMMAFSGTHIQVIEVPGIDSSNFDQGIANTADTVLLFVDSEKDIPEVKKNLIKARGKKIIVYNKTDLLSTNEKRKLSARLKSKKQDFVLISLKSKEGLEELQSKIFESFNILRVYMKEPGKERSPRPIILKPGAVVEDVAEKILKGFSNKVKKIRIWGPSSKFSGQIVGLKHKLKDLDTVEFKTK